MNTLSIEKQHVGIYLTMELEKLGFKKESDYLWEYGHSSNDDFDFIHKNDTKGGANFPAFSYYDIMFTYGKELFNDDINYPMAVFRKLQEEPNRFRVDKFILSITKFKETTTN